MENVEEFLQNEFNYENVRELYLGNNKFDQTSRSII